MSRYVEIEKWGVTMDTLSHNLTSAGWWEVGGGYRGSDACNTLRGTDGQQFHPDVQEDELLWIFQTDLCRVMFTRFKVSKISCT